MFFCGAFLFLYLFIPGLTARDNIDDFSFWGTSFLRLIIPPPGGGGVNRDCLPAGPFLCLISPRLTAGDINASGLAGLLFLHLIRPLRGHLQLCTPQCAYRGALGGRLFIPSRGSLAILPSLGKLLRPWGKANRRFYCALHSGAKSGIIPTEINTNEEVL